MSGAARRPNPRRRALGRGRRAETLAALYLRCKGYKILARTFRTQLGEIDIIARRGSTLAVIEVKYRPDRGQAAYSITPAQRHRIETATRGFIAAHPRYADLHVRFDAVLMAPWCWPEHLSDAWRS